MSTGPGPQIFNQTIKQLLLPVQKVIPSNVSQPSTMPSAVHPDGYVSRFGENGHGVRKQAFSPLSPFINPVFNPA